MVKNEKRSYNYTYGNTAYELQPEIVKKEKKKASRRPKKNTKKKLKVMSMIGVVCIFSFLSLARFSAIINLQGNIRFVKSEISKIQKENENLEVDIAESNNIKAVQEVAVNNYKMVYPENSDIVYVDVNPLTLPDDNEKKSAFQFVQRLLGLLN